MDNLLALFEFFKQYPPLALLLLTIPFVALAYFLDVFPTRRLALFMIAPLAVSLALLLRADVLPLVAVLDLILLVAAIVDMFSLPQQDTFGITREIKRIASLGKRHPVALTIANRTQRDYVVAVRDGLPEVCEASIEFDNVDLSARSRVTLRRDLICGRRGAYRIEGIFLSVASRWGLWRRIIKYPVVDDLHVYPDMQQLSKYALLARTNRLSLMGVRRHRKIGQDNEFERLRDFTRDDHYKHIDWRSTARRHKLTVRDFQSNQSQRIIFLVDCGRMMVNQSQGLTLLDHALNASLMLSYVALRQGDSVGMMAFSDKIHAYIPPKGGMQQMNRLLCAAFDRFPALVESRYDQAFLNLSQKCQKRSLVVLITNVIDEVNATQVESYLGSAGLRHLPLCVLLREPRLVEAAERPIMRQAAAAVTSGGVVALDRGEPDGIGSDYALAADEGLYVASAASSIMLWRYHVINQLQHRGVLVLDVGPDEITAPLVNQYLEIKARHLL